MIFTDTVCNYLISRTVTARVEIRKGSRKKRKEGREGKNTPRIFPSIWVGILKGRRRGSRISGNIKTRGAKRSAGRGERERFKIEIGLLDVY